MMFSAIVLISVLIGYKLGRDNRFYSVQDVRAGGAKLYPRKTKGFADGEQVHKREVERDTLEDILKV